MTGVPCGARDDELTAQYTLSAFTKSGGQTQIPAPAPLRSKDSRPMNYSNLVFEAMLRSLLPVHVQSDLLLPIWNGHIPLRRSNDDRLP